VLVACQDRAFAFPQGTHTGAALPPDVRRRVVAAAAAGQSGDEKAAQGGKPLSLYLSFYHFKAPRFSDMGVQPDGQGPGHRLQRAGGRAGWLPGRCIFKLQGSPFPDLPADLP